MKQEVPDRDPENPAGSDGVFPGYYAIGKGIVADSTYTMPMYIMDLTRYPNGPVNTTFGSNCLYQLRFGPSGGPNFDERPTQIATGAFGSTSKWILERANNTLRASYHLQHMWYDIRLKLYGCRKQPVTYDIMLVRFTEDYLVPDYNVTASTGPLNVDLITRNQFWQQFCRSATLNTILPQSQGWSRGLRVLRSARYNLTAALSNDLDRVPESVDLKWFVKDSRVLRYSQNQSAYQNQTDINSTGWIQNQDSSFIEDPSSQKARTFLIIRATDMTQTLPGSTGATRDDMDDTPSFDFCVRRKTRLICPIT